MSNALRLPLPDTQRPKGLDKEQWMLVKLTTDRYLRRRGAEGEDDRAHRRQAAGRDVGEREPAEPWVPTQVPPPEGHGPYIGNHPEPRSHAYRRLVYSG